MSTQEWLIVYGISLVSGIVVLVLLFVLFAKANKDLTPSVAVSFGIVLFLAEIGLNALYVRYGHIGLPGFAGLALVLTPGIVDWGALWPWSKAAGVLGMTWFHMWLAGQRRALLAGKGLSGRRYRMMNEVPTLLMVVIVLSVIVRF